MERRGEGEETDGDDSLDPFISPLLLCEGIFGGETETDCECGEREGLRGGKCVCLFVCLCVCVCAMER